MALSSNFERWLEEKIDRIKTQGGHKYFGRRESDEEPQEAGDSIGMDAQGQRPPGANQTTRGDSTMPLSPGSPDNYYKFAWNEGDEQRPQANRGQTHPSLGAYNFQTNFRLNQPTNYYSITDIIDDDDDDDDDEFELDQNTEYGGGEGKYYEQTWSFEDDFKPQAQDLGEGGGGSGFGERELGDGHSQPESALGDPARLAVSVSGSSQDGNLGSLSIGLPTKDFDQPTSSVTDVKFIGGQYGGHPQVVQPSSPTSIQMNTGGAILPMDGLHDLSMEELDSVDSRDVEERSEMLDLELDRCESIDLDDADERPIVTVDQATLLQQWKQKSKQLKLAMLSAGLVLMVSVVALTIYLIVHFH